MIKSIYLENFKTHLSSKFNFSSGTNILVGKIGSGKSSVTDAICYALYGTFPSLYNKKLKLIDVLMFKPTKKEKAQVILELEVDGVVYKIEREINSKSQTLAKIYKDGKIIAGPKQTDVTEKIQEIIGIDYDLFTKIIYSEQNELDYFLKIPPSKRKEKFDDLFGISKLDKIKEGARSLDRYLDYEIKSQEKLIDQLNLQLNSYNFQDLNAKKQEISTKISDLEKDLYLQKDNEKKNYEILEKIKLKKKDHEEINRKILILRSNLKSNEDFISKHKLYVSNKSKEEILLEKQNIKSKIDEIRQKLDKKHKLITEKDIYENELNKINKIIVDLVKKKNDIENKIKELNIGDIENQINLKKDEINLLNVNKSTIDSKIMELENSIKELEKGFLRCPVCDSLFSKEDIDKKLILKRNDLEINKQKLKIIEDKIVATNYHLQDLEKTKEIRKKIDLEYDNCIKEIENNRLKINEISEKISNISKDVSLILETESDLQTLENTYKDYDIILDVFEKKIECELLKKDLVVLEENLKNINYNEEEYMNIYSTYENQKTIISSITEKIKSNSLLLEDINKQISIYENLLNNKKNNEIIRDKFILKKQNISYFIQAIELSQNQLRKVLIDNINEALSIIWPKIYPYTDFISARLRAEDDYVLEVKTKMNQWLKVEGFLSGGERACAALSIRIAIALILTKNLGLLILDEPTHNLDKESIDKLVYILEDEISEFISQIIIITHDERLLETTNPKKYLIERDKDNDGVSEISEKISEKFI